MHTKTVATLALCLTACASGPSPTAQLAEATAAIRGAEVAGARDVPQAALHLQLAEEQLRAAEKLVTDEEHQRARAVALRSRQDAELAVAMARERESQQKLDAMMSDQSRTRSRKADRAGSSARPGGVH